MVAAIDPLPIVTQSLSFLLRHHDGSLSITKLRLTTHNFGRQTIDLYMNFSDVASPCRLCGLVDAFIHEELPSEFAHGADLLLEHSELLLKGRTPLSILLRG